MKIALILRESATFQIVTGLVVLTGIVGGLTYGVAVTAGLVA